MDTLTQAEWTLIVLVAMLGVLLYSAVALTYGVMPRRKDGDSDLGRWARLLCREPLRVRAAAVVLVGAAATVAASFGFEIDGETQAAIIGGIAAVALAVSELARGQVTPVADPVVPKGTTVKRV